MKLEKYDPEKYEEHLKERFGCMAIPPDELERYREVIEQGLEDFREVFGIESEFKIVFAEVDMDRVREEYPDDPPRYTYWLGMSLSKENHEIDENTVFLKITDEMEHWEKALKYMLAHEIAHQEFFKRRELDREMSLQMLFEAHAIQSSEKVSEEKGYGFTVKQFERPKADPEELREEIEKKREWEEDESDERSYLLSADSERWGKTGYRITFYLADDVMERNNLSVDDLLEIDRERWEKELRKSIDRLYG